MNLGWFYKTFDQCYKKEGVSKYKYHFDNLTV